MLKVIAAWPRRRNGPRRLTRHSSTACPIRKATPTTWCLHRAGIHLDLPGHRTTRILAHLVIDYVPGPVAAGVEIPKTLVASFRNHGAFHEDCTVMIATDISRDQAEMAAHRRLLVSARRDPSDVFWQTADCRRAWWIPDQGVAPIAGGG